MVFSTITRTEADIVSHTKRQQNCLPQVWLHICNILRIFYHGMSYKISICPIGICSMLYITYSHIILYICTYIRNVQIVPELLNISDTFCMFCIYILRGYANINCIHFILVNEGIAILLYSCVFDGITTRKLSSNSVLNFAIYKVRLETNFFLSACDC